MDDEELKHIPNTICSDSRTEKVAPNNVRDNHLERNITESDLPITLNHPNEQDKLDANKHNQFNDDIKIIDLESRGEDGSVSSFGRSTSDSPNPMLHPAVYNGMPSTSASYSDRERETTSSPHSDESSSSSPKESPSRYTNRVWVISPNNLKDSVKFSDPYKN